MRVEDIVSCRNNATLFEYNKFIPAPDNFHLVLVPVAAKPIDWWYNLNLQKVGWIERICSHFVLTFYEQDVRLFCLRKQHLSRFVLRIFILFYKHRRRWLMIPLRKGLSAAAGRGSKITRRTNQPRSGRRIRKQSAALFYRPTSAHVLLLAFSCWVDLNWFKGEHVRSVRDANTV